MSIIKLTVEEALLDLLKLKRLRKTNRLVAIEQSEFMWLIKHHA